MTKWRLNSVPRRRGSTVRGKRRLGRARPPRTEPGRPPPDRRPARCKHCRITGPLTPAAAVLSCCLPRLPCPLPYPPSLVLPPPSNVAHRLLMGPNGHRQWVNCLWVPIGYMYVPARVLGAPNRSPHPATGRQEADRRRLVL